MSSRIDLGTSLLRASVRSTQRALGELGTPPLDAARIGAAVAHLERLGVDCRVVSSILRDELPARRRRTAEARTPAEAAPLSGWRVRRTASGRPRKPVRAVAAPGVKTDVDTTPVIG